MTAVQWGPRLLMTANDGQCVVVPATRSPITWAMGISAGN